MIDDINPDPTVLEKETSTPQHSPQKSICNITQFIMLPLIGVWKLLFVTDATSNTTDLTGRISFLQSGFMHVRIRSPDINYHLPETFDWDNATDAQIRVITRPVTAYCGQYRVVNESGQLYTHTKLDVSLDPTWMEEEQVRHATFENWGKREIMTLGPVDVSALV
jgi:hypothetical protein